MKLSDLKHEIHQLDHWAHHGCGNHGCRIKPPVGMGTNAGCQCNPHAFAERLLWLACELDKAGKYGRWEQDDK